MPELFGMEIGFENPMYYVVLVFSWFALIFVWTGVSGWDRMPFNTKFLFSLFFIVGGYLGCKWQDSKG